MTTQTNPAALAAAYPSMAEQPAPAPEPVDPKLAAAYPSMFPADPPASPAPSAAREASAPPVPQPTEAPATEAVTAQLPSAGIEVQFPASLSPDPATLGAFESIAADLKLDAPAAQRLLDLHLAATEQITTDADAAWSATVKEWRGAVERDPEIGGAALRENMALARSVVATYGTPELRQVFNELGIGSHPELVRFVVRVGKALAAKGGGEARPSAPAPASADAALRAAYPSMFQR